MVLLQESINLQDHDLQVLFSTHRDYKNLPSQIKIWNYVLSFTFREALVMLLK